MREKFEHPRDVTGFGVAAVAKLHPASLATKWARCHCGLHGASGLAHRALSGAEACAWLLGVIWLNLLGGPRGRIPAALSHVTCPAAAQDTCVPQPQERPRGVPELLSRVRVPDHKCKARSLSSPSRAPGASAGPGTQLALGRTAFALQSGTAPHATDKPERAALKGKGQDQRGIN